MEQEDPGAHCPASLATLMPSSLVREALSQKVKWRATKDAHCLHVSTHVNMCTYVPPPHTHSFCCSIKAIFCDLF